jgi:hypothetical protein
MAKEGAKIIFNNVADLALLSDCFAERLEDPLGLVFEGGTGDDCVGSLFPEMVRAFRTCSRAHTLTYHCVV